MYKSYWQLDEKPFETGCDPNFFFASEAHQAILLKLRYAVENRRGGAMLSGISGIGKTLIVQMLRTMLADEIAPIAHLVFPSMTSGELLAYLADELTGEADSNRPTPGTRESVRRIQQFLAANAQRRRHALAIVDEAHLIDKVDCLDALRLLMNFEVGGRPAVTLLLVGQTGLLTNLERTPELEERLDVKCLLRPFTRAETAAYVGHRLQTAGGSRELFTEDGLDTLHELTHGIPRRINRLCDLALLIGFAEELESLSSNQLHSVHRELVAVAPE